MNRRNGKQDAFRHTFWNAKDTADFGKEITKVLTDAQEWNSQNDPLETQMDLFNNSRGRENGANYTYMSPNAVIAYEITYLINSGTIKYLNPIVAVTGAIIPGQTQIKWTNQ